MSGEPLEQPKGTIATVDRQLIVRSILTTLIVLGTVLRINQCFTANPLDYLVADTHMHYAHAFDVKGDDFECLLHPAMFQIFLSTVLRITADNHFLVSLVFSGLSVVTPWLYYRWFRELTGDKTISLLGYAIVTFMPSYFRIFSFFMDSVILLPLDGLSLWLTWRAARKGTMSSCVGAAIATGLACATKAICWPIVGIPWLYVAYQVARRSTRATTIKIGAASLLMILCLYSLIPLKTWSHIGCLVFFPDRAYAQRYFESGAQAVQVTHRYDRPDEHTTWVCVNKWIASCCCVPPFAPFDHMVSSRSGTTYVDIDYRGLFEKVTPPMAVKLTDRMRNTFENIVWFFFQYQWPEDQFDVDKPFPHCILPLARFLWLPLTIFVFAAIALRRQRDFMDYYFIAVTLAFLLQQSSLMEGRFKKPWDAVAIGAFVHVIGRSRNYRNLMRLPSLSEVAAPPATNTNDRAGGTTIPEALPAVSIALPEDEKEAAAKDD